MKHIWLDNLTVIISGASSGIGFALSKELITKYDCSIIGIARNQEKLEQAKNELGEKFSYFAFDVSKKDGWESFKTYLTENNVFPDGLINNAGYLPKFKSASKSEKDCIDTMDINYFSAVYSLTLLPLLKNCKSKKPFIINVSSSASLASVAGISAYCASKSAIRSFTEALAIEQKSVYVGYIMPGCCKTKLFNQSIINKRDVGLFDKIAHTPEVFAKKIAKRIAKRKRRTVLGFDAKLMDFAYRIAPVQSLKIIYKVIKKAKLESFSDIEE